MSNKAKFVVLLCLAPAPLLWWIVDNLAEAKYPVVSSRYYWHARLSGRPEFFRISGQAWFAPRGRPIHGYWPLRTEIADLAEDLLPSAAEFVRELVNKRHWHERDANIVAGITGRSVFDQEEAMELGANCTEADLDRDQILAYLAAQPGAEADVLTIYKRDAASRTRRAILETLFLGGLWCLGVVMLLGARVRSDSPLRSVQTLCPAVKGLVAAALLTACAFAPWVFLHYGGGAFTTYQGPNFIIYSSAYPWRGEIHYAHTFAYCTFVEMVGTWPLQLLKVLPEIKMPMPHAIALMAVLMYGAIGFVAGLIVGVLRGARAQRQV